MGHRQEAQSYLFESPGNHGQALEVALDDPMNRTPFGKSYGDVQHVIEGLISYYMQTEKLTNGHSYGADKLHLDPLARVLLAKAIREHYHIVFGVALKSKWPEITDGRLLWNWITIRKRNNVILRDGWAINSGRGTRRIEGDEVMATVYCYVGAAGGQAGLIKIGYTTQDLKSYLATKELAHQPILLATLPGGKDKEAKCLAECSQDKVVGNEWHAPTDRMYAYLQVSFEDLVPDFDRRFEKARNDYYGYSH